MKITKFKIAGLMSLLLMMSLFVSCDEDENRAPDLTENPEVREDVYNQILTDDQLFTEFTNRMSEDDRAMESFGTNPRMAGRMYGGNQMNRMMRNNPQRRDSMMQGMMREMERDTSMRPTPEMRRRMLQHMQVMMQRDSTFARQVNELLSVQPATGNTTPGTAQ